MHQIIYAMQFRGQAVPAEGQEGVLHARTAAPSSTISSTVDSRGVSGSIGSADGGEASFESEVRFTGESAFQESGTIHFGPGNSLRFSTVGEGYLGGSADPNVKAGVVSWRIDSGEGQFSGASGLITSNFTVDGAGQVVDSQFGVIWVR